MTPTRQSILLAFCAVFFALALGEFVLRLQPWVDLSTTDFSPKRSEILHHHSQKDESFTRASYGACQVPHRPVRILALGDSWMQENSMVAAFAAQSAAQATAPTCIEVCNAGEVSYSPSLYLLKARLVAPLCQPDMIVVNVDATDVADEWYHYRVQVRDFRTGRLLGIPMSLDAHDWAFYRGIEEAQSSHLYLMRAIKKAYHLYVFMPRLERLTARPPRDYASMMGIMLARNYTLEQRAELERFHDALTEMLAGLIKLGGNPLRVVLTYHPHYLGASSNPAENRYTNVVSELLQQASRESHVTFVDATGQVEKIHGPQYATAFRWPADPMSHLTATGYTEYGTWVAKTLGSLDEKLASPATVRSEGSDRRTP